jgi:polyisoprenoid-binding protein YceI
MSSAWAELDHYKFDIKGQHAFIQFKIKHLGYSWLLGDFRKFDGDFYLDVNNIEKSSVSVNIDTRSLDSNHAARDKHLKGKDFLQVDKYPQASFASNKVVAVDDGNFLIHGDLQLHGVSKAIIIEAKEIGHGPDPWMGYRAGFEGTTRLKLSDFNITKDLGPASAEVQLLLYIEGVRQPKEDSDSGSPFFE